MKSNLIGIFLLTIILIGCNKSNTKNDWDELNLNGEVKSITRISYDAKEAFGEVIKVEKSTLNTEFYQDLSVIFYNSGFVSKQVKSNSDSTDIFVELFDNKGSLVKEIYISQDRGSKFDNYLKKMKSFNSDGLLETKTIYLEDENGNEKSFLLTFTDDTIQHKTMKYENSKLVYENITNLFYDYDLTKEILYDSGGNEISSTTKEKDGTIMWKAVYEDGKRIYYSNIEGKGLVKKNLIDKSNKKSTRVEYNSNGKIESELVKLFDDSDNLIEKKTYNRDKELIGKESYLYNKEDSLIEKEVYYKNGFLKSKDFYNYEKDGKLEVKESFKKNGNLEEKKHITYDNFLNKILVEKYDGQGNIIEKDSFGYNDRKKLIYSESTNYEKRNFFSVSNEAFKPFKSKSELDETYIRSYKYKYDEKGNWVELIKYIGDEPLSIVERKIQYFK